MEQKLSVLRTVLESDEIKPTGGTACAIAGAMAASLIGNLARASIGGRYASKSEEDYREIERRAGKLSNEFLANADEELQSFERIESAYQIAQTSGIKETSRRQAVQEAIIHTTRLRLTIGQNCVRVLDLIDSLGSVADNDFSADRHCARTLATAALQGAIEKAEVYFREIWDDDTCIECGQEIQSLIKEIPDPYTWVRGDL